MEITIRVIIIMIMKLMIKTVDKYIIIILITKILVTVISQA